MKILVCMILFYPLLSFAQPTGIYDIWEPEAKGEPYLILATSGKVHEVPSKNQVLIPKLMRAKRTKQLVQLELTKKNDNTLSNNKRAVINGITFLNGRYDNSGKYKLVRFSDDDDDDPSYTVNALSMEEATRYFETMRTDTRDRSQCYNRAHVWSYELHKYYNIGTMKNWMFFTRRYIREYNYHWWFHVTPYTLVHGKGQVTLDRKFMRAPMPIEEWKNYFMRNNAPCPKIERYSSYRDNQESNYCYWIQTNMYFWQPYQIENLENGDPARWGWIPRELNVAYADAL